MLVFSLGKAAEETDRRLAALDVGCSLFNTRIWHLEAGGEFLSMPCGGLARSNPRVLVVNALLTDWINALLRNQYGRA